MWVEGGFYPSLLIKHCHLRARPSSPSMVLHFTRSPIEVQYSNVNLRLQLPSFCHPIPPSSLTLLIALWPIRSPTESPHFPIIPTFGIVIEEKHTYMGISHSSSLSPSPSLSFSLSFSLSLSLISLCCSFSFSLAPYLLSQLPTVPGTLRTSGSLLVSGNRFRGSRGWQRSLAL